MMKRKHQSDKVTRIILWICAASFVFASSIPVLLRKQGGSKNLVATVNGIEIGVAEYTQRVNQEQEKISYYRSMYGKQADQLMQLFGLSTNPEQSALTSLQYEKVLESVARDMDLQISSDYIASRLKDKQFAQSLGLDSFIDALGKIDTSKLKNLLHERGMTICDFENMIEDQIQKTLLLDFAQEAAYVPEFMVRQKYIQEHVGKDYSLLLFSPDHYLAQIKQQAVSDEELKTFFDKENKTSKRYMVPEKRSGTFWSFEPLNYGIDVTSKEVETKYERTKKSYLVSPETITVRKVIIPASVENKQEARDQAQAKLVELKANPKTFPVKDVEVIERNKTKDAAFSRAAFGLKEDGDISDIISTKEGFVILQRVKHEDAQYKSLTEVKDDIKDALLRDKFNRRFVQDVRKAINEGTVETFVADKKASKNVLADVMRTDDSLRNKLFALGVGKYGYVFDNNQPAVVRLDDIQKAHIPAFEDVRDVVRKDYFDALAEKAMHAAVDDAYAKLEQGQSMQSLASQSGARLISWQFAPEASDAFKDLKKEGIPVQLVQALTVPGALSRSEHDNGEYIIKLESVKEVDEADYESKKASVRTMLSDQMQGLMQGDFVASLTKNAKIEMYAPISRKV